MPWRRRPCPQRLHRPLQLRAAGRLSDAGQLLQPALRRARHRRQSGDGYGGTAGEYFEIAFNTIRGEQIYYVVQDAARRSCCAARPTIGAYFNGNVAVHDDLDAAVSLKMDEDDPGIGEDHDDVQLPRHRQPVRHRLLARSSPPATSMATAAPTSSSPTARPGSTRGAASGPGSSCTPPTSAPSELGFADIDNDGVTDVLYRDASGNLGYLKSGTVALVNFTTAPVPIKDLRFGDFDGDGKTDIFYTQGGQWIDLVWQHAHLDRGAELVLADLRAALRRVRRRARHGRRGGDERRLGLLERRHAGRGRS